MLVKTKKIPNVERRTKNDDSIPFGGDVVLRLHTILDPIEKFEVQNERVVIEMSLVTPSSDEGPPAVLLILVG